MEDNKVYDQEVNEAELEEVNEAELEEICAVNCMTCDIN